MSPPCHGSGVGAAFDKSFVGVSTGPDVLIFNRFEMHCHFIDLDKFKTVSTDPSAKPLLLHAR